MSALARILERMPDGEHRESFLRLVNEAHLADDSLDVLHLALQQEVAWSAVEAMRQERVNLERLHADLPERLETLASRIGSALGDTVAERASATIGDAVGTAVGGKVASMLESVADHVDGAVRDRLNRFSAGADGALSNLATAADTLDVVATGMQQAARDATAVHRHGLRGLWLTIITTALVAGLGAFGATTSYDHQHLYHSGWAAGAATVRATLHRR